MFESILYGVAVLVYTALIAKFMKGWEVRNMEKLDKLLLSVMSENTMLHKERIRIRGYKMSEKFNCLAEEES